MLQLPCRHILAFRDARNMKMLQLPCRHILAFRDARNICIFDKNLVAERWTLNYTVKSHQGCEYSSSASTVIHNPCLSEVAEKKLSSHQKYRKALKLCEERWYMCLYMCECWYMCLCVCVHPKTIKN